MACTGRRYDVDLGNKLKSEVWRFRFCQAVHLLSLLEKRPVTGDVRTSRLRFRTPPHPAFPASELGQLRESPAAGPVELEVNCFGLTGPSGVLPGCYTEFLQERAARKDTAAHAFFDVFSHRALCLYYEAWKKTRLHLASEKKDARPLSRYLLSFVGLPPGGTDEALPQDALAYFSGCLSRRPMAASTLPAVLGSYLRAPVRLEQFAGQWLQISPGEQTRLGHAGCALGKDTFLGERVWDQQNKVRLHIGPLPREQFTRLLPGSSGERLLAQLASACLGMTLGCDVCLILDGAQTPDTQLGQSRLGLDSWAKTGDIEGLRGDAGFCVQA